MKLHPKEQVPLEEALVRFSSSLAFSVKDFMWPLGIKEWLNKLIPPVFVPFETNHLLDSYVLKTMTGSFAYAAADSLCHAELA